MLECTLVDPVVDQPPILTSGGNFWQMYHRFAGRGTPCILTSSGQEWQFQVSYKHINWQIYSNPPQMHYVIYIMGCICQPFWILQEKVGIFFYY